MPSYNRVIIAGHLTRDPEQRKAGSSTVAAFGLALNRKYTTADGDKREEVTFVDVECWARTADLVCQYLSKGRACLIEGRLKLDQWQNQAGEKRQKLKVVADNVQFLGGRDEAAPRQAAEPAQPSGDLDDEPPF